MKKGDKGQDVKELQKRLGIDADGIFGPKTENAVKEFQKEHGLDPDGIVGPKTLSALGMSITKAVDASVIYNPLNVHITHSTGRQIKYLAIHFTAGSQSKDCCNIIKHVFETRNASADFAVDDKCMMQYNPDPKNYYCWAVGDKLYTGTGGGMYYGIAKNSNTISIEICSNCKKGYDLSKDNHEGWYFTEASLDNAVKLAKILMKKYDIPLARVIRHYDISGKICPGIIGWNNYKGNNSKKWEEFLNRLK